MSRTFLSGILLTVLLITAESTLAQRRVEVDPLLINDLKGKPASSLKLLEVEFRVISVDPARFRSGDMDRIRELFGLKKSAAPKYAGMAYPASMASRKLLPVRSDGPIRHQVMETKPFQDLLSWMSARHIASNASQSGRKIALGSTVVVLDQRVSAPRLSTKKDPRTGADVHSFEFVQSGLHLELTPVSQSFPKEKDSQPSEVWRLRLDRVLTTLVDEGGQSEQKIDRASHLVTLAVGQTAMVPDFVKTDRPAFVLLSVRPPGPEPVEGDALLTPTGEVIRLATEPGGPSLADRISRTVVSPTFSGQPHLVKPEKKVTLKPKPVDPAGPSPSRQLKPRDPQPTPPGVPGVKKAVPAGIESEIRELRTDVKSLRDEIQKLIRVMETQNAGASPAGQ